jgi:hypothetical protein
MTIPLRRLTGLLLIIVPIIFTACFTMLQLQFEYPGILRQPTADVLAKFQAGGPALVATWYVLTLTAVLFIPLVVLVHGVLAEQEAPLALWVATVFGVVAGLVQALGFLRWPFLVPHLAEAYLAPGASEAQRAAAAMVFEAFHRYAGMAIGEHLGYLSTSSWTFLVALLMLRAPRFGRWLGVSGMALALGVAAGLLEPAGWEPAGIINMISYLAWAVWLVIVGVVLLVRRPSVAINRIGRV